MSSSAALDVLGGQHVFGHQVQTILEINDLIQAGFPGQALVALKARTHFTNREVARALGVSEKTVERAAADTLIKPSTSDRLYRTARIIELATEVLCDEQQALEWLRSPQYGLGGRVALDLLSTDAGTEQIEAELQQIKFGFLA